MPKILVHPRYLTNLTRKEQIIELNNEVRCTLKISAIHGIGVFSLRPIYKGERCYLTPRIEPRFYNLSYADLTQLFPEIRELIIQRWASVVNRSLFRSPNDDQSLLMFVNHSSEPNYDVVSDTALKNIKKDEELLEDYTVMKNYQLAYPNLEKWMISSKKNLRLSILEKIKKLLRLQ